MKDQSSPPVRSATCHTAQKPLMTSLIERNMLSKTYDMEHTRVLVTWQECLRKDKELLPGKGILFFPGWPLRAESASLRRLTEELANNSSAKTYVIHTRSEQIIPDSLYQEAQAVCKFVAEMQIKQITLVGYSQGGIKAIDTIALLQAMNSDICIEGLILVVPVGLNEIGGGELVRRYIVDSLITSFIVVLREVVSKPALRQKSIALVENSVLTFRACLDFFLALLKEMIASQLEYLARFKNELKEMAKRNPYLDEIRVPVVLVQGSRDRVSDRGLTLAQVRSQLGRVRLQDTTEDLLALREQLLAESLFSQSPYVIMVKAQKFGTHLLPLFRPRSVTRASLYLLQRFHRRSWTNSPEPRCEQAQTFSNLAGGRQSSLGKERL